MFDSNTLNDKLKVPPERSYLSGEIVLAAFCWAAKPLRNAAAVLRPALPAPKLIGQRDHYTMTEENYKAYFGLEVIVWPGVLNITMMKKLDTIGNA